LLRLPTFFGLRTGKAGHKFAARLHTWIDVTRLGAQFGAALVGTLVGTRLRTGRTTLSASASQLFPFLALHATFVVGTGGLAIQWTGRADFRTFGTAFVATDEDAFAVLGTVPVQSALTALAAGASAGMFAVGQRHAARLWALEQGRILVAFGW
jgi:hypothetical protein